MGASGNNLIVLVGLMGSGKSTVGNLLAESLQIEWSDADAELSERAGRSVADIFAQDGEPAFRALEADLVQELLSTSHGRVLSLGGGAVMNEATRESLKNCTTVWLKVSPAEALRRMSEKGIQRRPLLAGNPLQVLEKLAAERDPYHQEVARVVIEVDGHTKDELVDQVLAYLRKETP